MQFESPSANLMWPEISVLSICNETRHLQSVSVVLLGQLLRIR